MCKSSYRERHFESSVGVLHASVNSFPCEYAMPTFVVPLNAHDWYVWNEYTEILRRVQKKSKLYQCLLSVSSKVATRYNTHKWEKLRMDEVHMRIKRFCGIELNSVKKMMYAEKGKWTYPHVSTGHLIALLGWSYNRWCMILCKGEKGNETSQKCLKYASNVSKPLGEWLRRQWNINANGPSQVAQSKWIADR